MHRKGGCGLGIDNHCAVVFTAAGYRVLTTKARLGAHALRLVGGVLIERRLDQTTGYLPIESMYAPV